MRDSGVRGIDRVDPLKDFHHGLLAPVIVSVGLIVGSLLLLERQQRGRRLHFPARLWGLAVTGGALVLLSFMLDAQVVLEQEPLPPFRWGLFGTGIACGATALTLGLRDLDAGPTRS